VGVILSAMYALTLYRNVMFEGYRTPEGITVSDMGGREWIVLLPLGLATLIFGVYPQAVFDLTEPAVARMIEPFQTAIQAAR